MVEHIFINKRKKQRKKNTLLLSVRVILSLISLSILVYIGFASFVGNPNDIECVGECEASIGIGTWLLALAIMFAVVIAAGALLGLLISVFKRITGSDKSVSPFAQVIERAQDENRNEAP